MDWIDFGLELQVDNFLVIGFSLQMYNQTNFIFNLVEVSKQPPLTRFYS